MKKTIIFYISILLIVSLTNKIQAVELNNIDIHGFISQGYLKTNKNNYLAETEDGTFQFNEMGLNFSTDLTDQLHIGMQFFARDLGDVGNDSLVLDWAFADYRWQNWIGFRIGKIKFDHGLYNETREMDMLRTSVMLPQSIYPELWRNAFSTIKGVASYGYVPLSFMGNLAYNFQIGAMDFKQDSGYRRFFGIQIHDFLDISEIDADYAWVGSLAWNMPIPGLKFKMTYHNIEGQKGHGDIWRTFEDPNRITFPVDLEFKERDGYIASIEYTLKNLILVAEYMQEDFPFVMTFQPWPPQGSTPSPQGWTPIPPTRESEGWYVSGSYRFTRWLEMGLSYSEYYPNADNKHGYGKWPGYEFLSWLKTTTLSTSFDINDYWVLKLETSYNDGAGGINMMDNPEGLNRYWCLFASKITFSF
ncbi:hypothetical protein JXL19_01720 [bacterium]|nr:hypothetical protein [bacterium]